MLHHRGGEKEQVRSILVSGDIAAATMPAIRARAELTSSEDVLTGVHAIDPMWVQRRIDQQTERHVAKESVPSLYFVGSWIGVRGAVGGGGRRGN